MSEENELVMPFVVVTSVGGPYDDAAFVAGYECGAADAVLRVTHPYMCSMIVHSGSVPQIDLIAMRYGYFVAYCQGVAEGWTALTLSREAPCRR